MTHGPLRESHIVPKWAYRRVVDLYGGAERNPVQLADGTAVATSRQVWDWLLCDACEQKFGVDENYVSGLVLQPDESFPLETLLVPLQTSPSAMRTQLLDARSLDCGALGRFAASVFWRAGISGRVPEARLGPYAEHIRRYLRGEAPFPDQGILLVTLARGAPRAPVDRFFTLPTSSRVATYHAHYFSLFGLHFTLALGQRLQEAIKPLCITRSPVVLVSDGKEIASKIIPDMIAAVPKGKFAADLARLGAYTKDDA